LLEYKERKRLDRKERRRIRKKRSGSEIERDIEGEKGEVGESGKGEDILED
jgi:hypothetical protein